MLRARRLILASLILGVPLLAASPALARGHGHGHHGMGLGLDEQRMEFLLAPGFVFCEDDLSIINVRHRHLNLLRAYPALNEDGTANQIVEIPSGDNKKFEVKPDTGQMVWDTKNGKPRYIKFTGYPGNYGAIPGTMQADGDPLDVLSLGGMELRADVVGVKIIGAIHLHDAGDEDSKLLAVIPDSPLGAVNDVGELEAAFPGILDHIYSFFANYKGANSGVEVVGFFTAAEAQAMLQEAIANFQ